MGFEVIYKFHERLEEGGYNKEETKQFKKKVGDPFEEVPLEKLAGAIMAQLSRRDIWIEDVEVYEYSKKQVTFRETKGGIIVKNKKFLVDTDAGSLVVQDIQEAPTHALANYQPQPHELIPNERQQLPQQANGAFHPHNGNQLRPIKWMVFAPELPMMAEVKQKNLRFTMDKKYPVFKETPMPLGCAYTTLDDTGREQLISDKYFVPAETNLVLDREIGFSESPRQRDGGKLLWGNTVQEDNMPDVRRR
jgi:hypothetical protein